MMEEILPRKQTETFTEEVSEAVTAVPSGPQRNSYSNRPKDDRFIEREDFLITGSPKYDISCVSI
ncbi:hypothetical protein A9239_13070 [Methanosarcina sp. A14]|uniref:hypothetical protein n=1 Tax=Methanosarcina TaxID=2207 RepID=UPI00064EF7D1|nr:MULTISPECIES: hypothetical protein [Methanosarcina]OED04321.1 hypothetical protein A9239_13070 [Methanosarcina sp. A14]